MIDFPRPKLPERKPLPRHERPAQVLVVLALVAFIPMFLFQLLGGNVRELASEVLALWPLWLIWGIPLGTVYFLYRKHRA